MWKSRANPLKDKSYAFSVRIVRACLFLIEKKREYVLSKQLMRSGTSIGANIEEALQAQSRKDFIAKLSISLKEAHETDYWIRLLSETQFFTTKQSSSLRDDLSELIRLLTSILKTVRSKKN